MKRAINMYAGETRFEALDSEQYDPFCAVLCLWSYESVLKGVENVIPPSEIQGAFLYLPDVYVFDWHEIGYGICLGKPTITCYVLYAGRVFILQ